MPKRVVTITDASLEIGLGHAMRQLSLAQYLKRNSWDVSWYSASREVQEIAHKNDIHHVIFPSLECACNALDRNIEILIDIHQRDLPRLPINSNLSKAVTLISDIGYEYPIFGAHIILVGSDLEVWSKVNSIPLEDHKVLVHSGRKWMIFREEFAEMRQRERKNPKNILVCHGGSDPHGLTEFTLNALDLVEIDITITILATDNFQSLSRIKTLANHNRHPCDVIINSKSVRSHMERADFAIINGGNVRYELCLVGTPYMAISIQKSQYNCTHQLAKRGIGLNVGLASDLNPKILSDLITQMHKEQTNKIEMSKNMVQLFDLKGVHRIVELLAQPSNARRSDLEVD